MPLAKRETQQITKTKKRKRKLNKKRTKNAVTIPKQEAYIDSYTTNKQNTKENKKKQKQFACNRFVRHRRYKQHRYYNNVPHRHIMDCNHIANQAISRFHAKTIFYTDSNAFGQPFPIY